MSTRLLTVEPFGDFLAGGRTSTASAVRLKGKWLQRAGFLPGHRVSLKVVGRGAIELRVQAPSETPEQTAERLRVADALDRAGMPDRSLATKTGP